MGLGLPPKPSRESLVAMCRENPEAVADLVLMLWGKVEELAATIAALGEEIAALKAKLAKDSHNSSKPPSSDRHNPGGARRPRRKPRGARRGRPAGSPGTGARPSR